MRVDTSALCVLGSQGYGWKLGRRHSILYRLLIALLLVKLRHMICSEGDWFYWSVSERVLFVFNSMRQKDLCACK